MIYFKTRKRTKSRRKSPLKRDNSCRPTLQLITKEIVYISCSYALSSLPQLSIRTSEVLSIEHHTFKDNDIITVCTRYVNGFSLTLD